MPRKKILKKENIDTYVEPAVEDVIVETVTAVSSEEPMVYQKRINSKLLLIIAFCLLIVLGGSYFFYKKVETNTSPNLQMQKETADYVSTVGKLILLPEGEAPTVAIVSNKEKLSNQPFFKLAENGDVLLAYKTALKAILYRPMINKIINVAEISVGQ